MSSFYDSGRQGFLDGTLDWDADDVKVMLVKATYVFNASHVYVSDVVAYDNGRSLSLTGKTTTGGVADADNTTVTALDGESTAYMVLFADSGLDSTSRLIGNIDDAPEFPFTPAPGQNVAITWNDGADKIFKL